MNTTELDALSLETDILIEVRGAAYHLFRCRVEDGVILMVQMEVIE